MRPPRPTRPTWSAVAVVVLAIGLAACATVEPDGGYAPEDPATVTLLSHDSFVMPDEVIASLAAEGIELELLPGAEHQHGALVAVVVDPDEVRRL